MAALAKPGSANFSFLARYDDVLVGVAAQAERYFADDPVTCLMKLRQFGELLAQQLAARAGVFVGVDEAQSVCSAARRAARIHVGGGRCGQCRFSGGGGPVHRRATRRR